MTLRHRIASLLRLCADRIDVSNVAEIGSYADFCQRLTEERNRSIAEEHSRWLARRELPDAVAREVEACKVITFTR